MIPPLGDDEETKKRRQQESVDAAKRELSDRSKDKNGQIREGSRRTCLVEAPHDLQSICSVSHSAWSSSLPLYLDTLNSAANYSAVQKFIAKIELKPF